MTCSPYNVHLVNGQAEVYEMVWRGIDKGYDKVKIDTPKRCKRLAELAAEAGSFITQKSVTSLGTVIYPQFNSVTHMGDGFPLVRWTLAKGGKEIFISFLSNWMNNYKLQFASNRNSIPYILDVKDIPKHFPKIRV